MTIVDAPHPPATFPAPPTGDAPEEATRAVRSAGAALERRRRRAATFALAVVGLLGGVAIALAYQSIRTVTRRHRHTELIWGTAVVLEVRPGARPLPPERSFRAAATEAVDYLHWVDRVFSPFRDDSLVTAVRSGRRSERSLSERDPDEAVLLQVIRACRDARALTDGAFDPWAAHGGFDPSGYVKGWAADRVADLLMCRGFDTVGVNAGGDVTCRGLLDGERPWRVGIRHPTDPLRVVHTVEALDVTVCTSGLYERGGHIVDPGTGQVAAGARSATVWGPDAGTAEAVSTALIVRGRGGLGWFGRLPGAPVGYHAYVIDPPTSTPENAPPGHLSPQRLTPDHLTPDHPAHPDTAWSTSSTGPLGTALSGSTPTSSTAPVSWAAPTFWVTPASWTVPAQIPSPATIGALTS